MFNLPVPCFENVKVATVFFQNLSIPQGLIRELSSVTKVTPYFDVLNGIEWIASYRCVSQVNYSVLQDMKHQFVHHFKDSEIVHDLQYNPEEKTINLYIGSPHRKLLEMKNFFYQLIRYCLAARDVEDKKIIDSILRYLESQGFSLDCANLESLLLKYYKSYKKTEKEMRNDIAYIFNEIHLAKQIGLYRTEIEI